MNKNSTPKTKPEADLNLPEDPDAEIKKQRSKRFVDTREDSSFTAVKPSKQ